MDEDDALSRLGYREKRGGGGGRRLEKWGRMDRRSYSLPLLPSREREEDRGGDLLPWFSGFLSPPLPIFIEMRRNKSSSSVHSACGPAALMDVGIGLLSLAVRFVIHSPPRGQECTCGRFRISK